MRTVHVCGISASCWISSRDPLELDRRGRLLAQESVAPERKRIIVIASKA